MTWYHPALAPRIIKALDGEVAALKAEIERLRAALKPFAQIADKFENDGLPPTIAMIDCRYAQDVLRDHEQGSKRENG